eukprot:CAMPEP_0172603020 /NCGR_PEP_ID=MMETSP1068-20121228/23204_1 /TAXON_ID=35684 /ORGANISM="Pseudopedinella elastica, Strain CCMP716" /LENGTH=287 /DNA_ID=CAMNT_0013404577 /DNA_START=12 /DNA_END=873 /DNA_ORIENTATION=-
MTEARRDGTRDLLTACELTEAVAERMFEVGPEEIHEACPDLVLTIAALERTLYNYTDVLLQHTQSDATDTEEGFPPGDSGGDSGGLPQGLAPAAEGAAGGQAADAERPGFEAQGGAPRAGECAAARGGGREASAAHAGRALGRLPVPRLLPDLHAEMHPRVPPTPRGGGARGETQRSNAWERNAWERSDCRQRERVRGEVLPWTSAMVLAAAAAAAAMAGSWALARPSFLAARQALGARAAALALRTRGGRGNSKAAAAVAMESQVLLASRLRGPPAEAAAKAAAKA